MRSRVEFFTDTTVEAVRQGYKLKKEMMKTGEQFYDLLSIRKEFTSHSTKIYQPTFKDSNHNNQHEEVLF